MYTEEYPWVVLWTDLRGNRDEAFDVEGGVLLHRSRIHFFEDRSGHTSDPAMTMTTTFIPGMTADTLLRRYHPESATPTPA